MIFRRIFKILQANMGRQESGKSISDEEFTENKPSQELDPQKLKEAEFYANLELKPGAGFGEIKAAYKNLMKKYHPDKFHGNEEQRRIAETITSRLNEAYMYFEKKFGQNS